MASSLIVEDGSGMVAANAYASLVDVLDYWTARNDNTLSALATDALRDGAVIRATQFIDLMWGERFKGYKEFEVQSLEWPRDGVLTREGWAVSGVPPAVVTATAELARLAVGGPLGGAGATSQSPGKAEIESLTAGSVAIKYRGGLKSAVETNHADKFFLVERALRPLLRGSGINQGSSR